MMPRFELGAFLLASARYVWHEAGRLIAAAPVTCGLIAYALLVIGGLYLVRYLAGGDVPEDDQARDPFKGEADIYEQVGRGRKGAA